MKEKMLKMLAKKRDLHPAEKKAKMDVVKDLKDLASSAMSDKMDGLKKVSVMCNSKEGLKHGLEKAGQIVSGNEMDQMKDHAENDLGDYKSAMEEHSRDEDNQEDGWQNDENRYSDGGEVSDGSQQSQSDQNLQNAQSSMRDAFHYNEGGEVPELEESPDKGDYDSVDAEDNNDKMEEESPDQGEYSDVDQESPADHEDDEDNEFHGLDMKDLNDKLEKLMKMKKRMESR
jgi:hypothetical protein